MMKSIYEIALDIHNESGMRNMWNYLTDQVKFGNISEDEAECIGEEIMIYGY